MTSVKKKRLLVLLVLPFACLPALAQDEQANGTSSEFVEPIVTEETLPNEVGDWDLRLSCGYTHRKEARTADCVRAQVFFGIARRWGGEVNLPLTYAMDTPAGHGFGRFLGGNQVSVASTEAPPAGHRLGPGKHLPNRRLVERNRGGSL